MLTFRIALVSALLCVLSACSAPKKVVEQKIISNEAFTQLSYDLDKKLDHAFGAWIDPKIENFLNSVIKQILSSDPTYQSLVDSVHVHLLASKTPYIAAGLGNTVYVSRGMLELFLYENELAFSLAIQLALMKQRIPENRYLSSQARTMGEGLVTLPTTPLRAEKDLLSQGWFEHGGLFDYGSESYLNSEKDAIKLIHLARYDSRGSVMLIQRLQGGADAAQMRALGKILPEPELWLGTARDEVAKLSPLRDPIIKSPAFDEFRLRLKKKKG